MASEQQSTNQYAMDNSNQLFTQSDKEDPFQVISAASEAKSTKAPAPEKQESAQNATTAGDASALFNSSSTDINTADSLFAHDSSVNDPFFQQTSAEDHSFFDGLSQQQQQEGQDQQVSHQNTQVQQQVPRYNQQQDYYYQQTAAANGVYSYAQYSDQGYTYQAGTDPYATSSSPYDPNAYVHSAPEATYSYDPQDQNATLHTANDAAQQNYDAYSGAAVNGYQYTAQPQSQTQLTSAYTPTAEQQAHDYQSENQNGYAYAPVDNQQTYIYGSQNQTTNAYQPLEGANANYSYELQSQIANGYTNTNEQHTYSYQPQTGDAYAYQPSGNVSYAYDAATAGAAGNQYSTEYTSDQQQVGNYQASFEVAQQGGQNYSNQPQVEGTYVYGPADEQYTQQDYTYQSQLETSNVQDYQAQQGTSNVQNYQAQQGTSNVQEYQPHLGTSDVQEYQPQPETSNVQDEAKDANVRQDYSYQPHPGAAEAIDSNQQHPVENMTDDKKQQMQQDISVSTQHIEHAPQHEEHSKDIVRKGQEVPPQENVDTQQAEQVPETGQPAISTGNGEAYDPFTAYQQDQSGYDFTQYQSFSYEQSYEEKPVDQKQDIAYEEDVQEVDLVAAPIADHSEKEVTTQPVNDHQIDELVQNKEGDAAVVQAPTTEQTVPENVPASGHEQQESHQQQPAVGETGQNYDSYAYYQQQYQSPYDYSVNQDQQYGRYYTETQPNGQQYQETLEQTNCDSSAYQDQQSSQYYSNEQFGDQYQHEAGAQEQASYGYQPQNQQYSAYHNETQETTHSDHQQREIQATEQETNEVSLEAVPSKNAMNQAMPLTPHTYSDHLHTQPDQQQQSMDTQTVNVPPSMYTPSKPHEVGGPARIEPYYGGRNEMERSTTMPASTVSRTASPQVDAMFPCPDPNCEGENKAKAKFCCECGRPLTALSRSTTPAMSVVSNALNTTPHMPPAIYQQSQQQQTPMIPGDSYGGYQEGQPATLPVESTELETTSTMHPETGVGYGGADMYEPQAQQELPPDPLNRARGCPIVTFGFGGKLCVMFPQTVQRFTQHGAYDTSAPITKRMPSVIQIKKLKDVLGEENEMVSKLSRFVGPVLMDSKVGTKNKKKDALAYMDGKINELMQATASSEHLAKAESKLLLWRLVKALLELDSPAVGDGDKTDNALRAAIRPPETTVDDQQGSFSIPAYSQPGSEAAADLGDRSTMVLEKLQNLLLNGDRSGAVDYAMQEDLWAHALIISSCVNKDVWKTVVTNFVERELSGSVTEGTRQDVLNVAGDKQGLRVLYSLFSGSGAASMFEFLKASMQQQRVKTPFGMGAPPHTGEERGDEDELSGWRTTLTLVLANRTPRDTEAITALGDILRSHGWIDAAHVCYLVSPQTSIHSGLDAPHVRLTLIGADGPSAFTDLDAYFLSELYEFAISSKQGNLALPFLQGYKLVHAWWLADLGYLSEAQRYCEAIANAVKAYTKGSPYLHRQLLEKLREFSELCEAASGHSLGDTGSWLKNKLSKNSLDSLWGSLEGKFNKFVSGEDVPVEEQPVRKSTEIMANPYDAAVDGPPVRSSSAFDFRNSGRASVGPESMRRAATPTANMASEAYGVRRTSSPGAQGLVNFAAHGFTPMSQYYGEQLEQKQREPENEPREVYGYGYGSQPAHATVSPFGHSTLATRQYGRETSTTSEGYGAPAPATASTSDWYTETYGQQTAPPATMNDYSPYEPQQPQQTTPPSTTSYTQQEDDEDDLGFGNSALKKAKASSSPAPGAEAPANQVPEEKTEQGKKTEKAEEKKTESKGWGIFSLFSRSSTPSNEKKAVKANLGDDNQFYFDEKEQRWINKALGSQPAPPPLPPPPKASPAAAQSNMPSPALSAPSMGSKPPPPSATSPPPPSSAAAAAFCGPPGPLARSPGAQPPTPGTPPPSGGRRGAGGRKPMRSRYVDVFNQSSPS